MATTTSGFQQSSPDPLLSRAQHTLIVHKLASGSHTASIVAPLRKTKPELSPHLLLISFRSFCIKYQLRIRDWSKKPESFIFVCVWLLTFGVRICGSARRIIIHSVLWQALRLIDSWSGKKPWDSLVLFEGHLEKKTASRSVAILWIAEDLFTSLELNLSRSGWLHPSGKKYGFCENIFHLDFECYFLLHPGHIGDISEAKGRRGSKEGYGAEGT